MELYQDLDPSDSDMLFDQSRRIYDKYIQLGSELEVHLSPSIVHTLTRDVHVGPQRIQCFEEAQNELFQLMEAEFPRSQRDTRKKEGGGESLTQRIHRRERTYECALAADPPPLLLLSLCVCVCVCGV
jgi:hypothetical protein